MEKKVRETYNVEYGVHGAMRINNRAFPTEEAALAFADRWARSNSQGHYWAEVTCLLSGSKGQLKVQYNLPRLPEGHRG